MGLEQPGFYSKDDLRSENRELALKMFFRELKTISFPVRGLSGCMGYLKPIDEQLRELISRWKITEEEIGSRLSLAISFPEGVVRNQWFYNENGTPFSLKHDGTPPKNPVVKKKSKKAKK